VEKGKSKTRKVVTYSLAISDKICEKLEAGIPLREICSAPGMPAYVTVMRWARDDVSGFRDAFQNATAMKYVAWEDECIQIADDASSDYVERGDEMVLNKEHISRSKQRIDTRMKLMSKRRPDLYADRQSIEHTGKDGGPVQVEQMPKNELQRLVNYFLVTEEGNLAQNSSTALDAADRCLDAAELLGDNPAG
jgi:hypothetical protein